MERHRENVIKDLRHEMINEACYNLDSHDASVTIIVDSTLRAIVEIIRILKG